MADGPASKKPRMGVNDFVGESDPRYAKACELYKAAGYVALPEKFEEIHCQKDK